MNPIVAFFFSGSSILKSFGFHTSETLEAELVRRIICKTKLTYRYPHFLHKTNGGIHSRLQQQVGLAADNQKLNQSTREDVARRSLIQVLPDEL